jgi:hypothetical protein
MQILEAHLLNSEVSWKWIYMLVLGLCLIAASLNVGQEYFFSAPNNRFISRLLKIPKTCHMHEKTNLSSCVCIFFPHFFSSPSVVRLFGDLCIVPNSTSSCFLSFYSHVFIHHMPFTSLSTEGITEACSPFTCTDSGSHYMIYSSKKKE